MKKTLLAVVLLTGVLTAAFANQAQEIFKKANDAYQANEFAKSTEMYERLVEMGYQSAELEYNLGNAYYRDRELGRAILHYERAILLSPNDADIQYNLDVARSQIVDELQPLPQFFLTAWWQKMRMSLSATAWGILALVIWWAGMAGLAVWLFGKNRSQKKKGFFYGLVGLVISLLPLALAFSRADFEQDSRQAIILAEETALRSAPDANGSEIIEIHEGLKVKLLDELSGWWQVTLPNGEKGWLDGEDLERI